MRATFHRFVQHARDFSLVIDPYYVEHDVSIFDYTYLT
jgi:hypothetical protein